MYEARAQEVTVIELQEETLIEMSDRIALEHEVSTSTLRNLVTSESQWNPNAVSDTGDHGLVQINLFYNPDVTKEQAFDPAFSLHFAADKISKGEEWLWTACSCIQYARALGVSIPPNTNAWDLEPNIGLGEVKKGDLVLLKYSTGSSHVGVFWGLEGDVLEVRQSNLEPCKAETIYVHVDDQILFGYWTSGN